MTRQMEGKVVIVTGAGGGIGFATALLFAEKGARVVVVDCNPEGGSKTVQKIQDIGGEAIFIEADLTQAERVRQMVQETVENYGKLDYAINNAGVSGEYSTVTNYSEASWDKAINVNLKGVWLCMKYEIPEMMKNKAGAIVNVASTSGLIAKPLLGAYVASKHGVVGLTKVAALESAADGIRVNAICPGMTDTPMIVGMDEKMLGESFDKAVIKRLAKPKEMAECALWLCSDGASFVTGHALVADGGRMAQ